MRSRLAKPSEFEPCKPRGAEPRASASPLFGSVCNLKKTNIKADSFLKNHFDPGYKVHRSGFLDICEGFGQETYHLT